MGRIRTIKPEFHAHEELSALPPETHLLAAALLNYADDEGYFNANIVLLKAGTTPLRTDKTRLEEQLLQLEQIGYVEIRREGIKSIGRLPNFDEHQRISHKTPSKLKGKFEELRNSSGSSPEPLRKVSGTPPEVLRPEGKGKEQGKEGNRESTAFAVPDWIDRSAWEAFEGMRRKIRKPMTDEARALAVKFLAKCRDAGQAPADVLNQSTMNSWQGLFELKGAVKPRSEATVGMSHQPRMSEEEAEEIRARIAAKRSAA